MKSKTAFKNIEDFLFQKDKKFVIQNYQRGYKWSVKKNEKSDSEVEKLLDNLLAANWGQPYFLQGVTVVENNNEIILIDGQQRTTTLYLLLWNLVQEKIKDIELIYEVREDSKIFIQELKKEDFDFKAFDIKNKSQDVFYFKKAIEQISSKIEFLKNHETKLNDFLEFVLTKVTILYIVIEQDKAIKTFTMMNGSKATMLQEELIKAEMLRRISLPDVFERLISSSVDDNLNELKEIISKEWEINALRGRYAREWDKWLYWWNRQDVKEFFSTEKPMGLLLEIYFWKKNSDKKIFNFENFKALLSEIGPGEKKKTKHVFKELRDLQKSFEDIFNIPKIHNYLKMSLLCSTNNDDKFEIINYYMQIKNEDVVDDQYAKWRLVGATHRQIVKSSELKDGEETKEDKARTACENLSLKFAYRDAYDLVLKQLLRLNVEEDNKLFNGTGRKFDFTIYGNKSLEHIHPKSKAYYLEETVNEEGVEVSVYKDGNDNILEIGEPIGNEWLNRDDMNSNFSEHSVGNLLLLDKNENSLFNNNTFEDKKKIYFDVNKSFKSRNLLHTISVFAKSYWNINEIEENQRQFIDRFKKDYSIS